MNADQTEIAANPAVAVTESPALTVQAELPLAFVRGEAVMLAPDDLYIPPDALEVLLDAFEGPLDFLWYLIRKHKFDIVDLPVNEITLQYMEYINLMQGMNFELAAEYLLMAAMLAEIKSRLLLPRQLVQQDTELDPRAELVRRLQEYERFKQAATQLDLLPRQDRDFFLVQAQLADNFSPLVILPDVSMQDLVAALADIAKRVQDFQHHQISKEKLSTRQRMSMILELLHQQGGYLAFADCFVLAEGRAGVVVSFLAVLELVKEQRILLEQVQAYGQIHLTLA